MTVSILYYSNIEITVQSSSCVNLFLEIEETTLPTKVNQVNGESSCN